MQQLSQIAALLLAGAIIGSALTLTRHRIATAARLALRTLADLAARAVAPIPLFRTHPGQRARKRHHWWITPHQTPEVS